MKVKILNTGKTEEYDDGYAMRLIEQGKAVPAPVPETKGKAEKKADGK